MSKTYIPEPDLCHQLVEGDETAFRTIFERYHRKVYRFAFNFLKDKEQSDEIVQETFLGFWLQRKKLDPDIAFTPLLFTIARRAIISAWRKAASSRKFREQLLQVAEQLSNPTEEYVFAGELKRVADDAINKLTNQQKEIFSLSRQEGLSYQEIADRLHISKNTVKYHLINALKTLKAHLGKHDILYLYLLVNLFG